MAYIQRNIKQRHALRLIQLFETVNERTPLNRHAAVIIDHTGVCFDHFRSHAELHVNEITGRPAASKREILSPSRSRDWLAGESHLRSPRSHWKTKIQRELRRRGRRVSNHNDAIPQ